MSKEVILEQLLQAAILSHREGNLEDAEYIYLAILHLEPNHPDANHNLGILFTYQDKVDLALPLFKVAFDTNPDQKLFVSSYIDALIFNSHFQDAKKLIDQHSALGLSVDQIDGLNQRLEESLENNVKIEKKQKTTVSEKRKRAPKRYKRKKRNNEEVLISPPKALVDSLLSVSKSQYHEISENLSQFITQRSPKYLLGWKALGFVLLQTGRLTEASFAFEKASELNREDIEVHTNLGIVYYELGKFNNAKASYERALRLNNKIAEIHNNLGAVQVKLASFSEAEASFRQSMTLKPRFADAYNNLGALLFDLGEFDEAEECYKRALELKPEFLDSQNNLANLMRETGRIAEAEKLYNEAIGLKPNYPEAQNNLANLLKEAGRFAEAEAIYRKVLMINPDFVATRYNLAVMLSESGFYKAAAGEFELIDYKQSKSYLLRCLFYLDEKDDFYSLLDELIARGEINSLIGSLIYRSERRYGLKRINPLVNDPLSFVTKTNLNTRCDFKKTFVPTIESILAADSLAFKSQGHLYNGQQTAGNLFGISSESVNVLEEIIRLEIENYRMRFEASKEGLIKHWPNQYQLNGWLVSMNSGGELAPHIHESGWISGVVYVNVPPKKKSNSGNLVVCLDESGYEGGVSEGGVSNENRRVIDVYTGDLVLFPASLMHHTVPFDSHENRVVLAFDLVPY